MPSFTRRAGSLFAQSFFEGAAALGRLHPRADPARHGLRVTRNVPYLDTGNRAHLLDVCRPDTTGTLPALLYLHGGGFRILSKDTHWLMALAFARRGFVVFTPNYRLAEEALFPAAVEDACAALGWVRRHAAEHGADPRQLWLAGESAGANLAVGLTVAACWPRPEPFARAVFDEGAAPVASLPACGIFQVSDVERIIRRKPQMRPFVADRLREVSESYLGPTPPAVGDPRLDLADPLVFLERAEPPARPLPPVFLPVGTWDPLLPDTRRLDVAWRRHGGRAVVRYYPRELHAFHAFVFREPARRCWAETYAFIDEVRAGGPRETGPEAGPCPAA